MDKERTNNANGFIEKSSEQQNSIEISKNAKGEYAWKIKVYCDDAVTRANKVATMLEQVRNALEATQ